MVWTEGRGREAAKPFCTLIDDTARRPPRQRGEGSHEQSVLTWETGRWSFNVWRYVFPARRQSSGAVTAATRSVRGVQGRVTEPGADAWSVHFGPRPADCGGESLTRLRWLLPIPFSGTARRMSPGSRGRTGHSARATYYARSRSSFIRSFKHRPMKAPQGNRRRSVTPADEQDHPEFDSENHPELQVVENTGAKFCGWEAGIRAKSFRAK
jgi:hypothetical protein